VTDELKRLMKEFEKELAILKGRVDGLEARVGELEATQFSTTTKLKGKTTFVIGANTFGGDLKNTFFDQYNVQNRPAGKTDFAKSVIKNSRDAAEVANQYLGGTSFNYDQQLDLLTSFTGKDLLKVRLRAGNFNNSAFGFNADSGVDSPFGSDYLTASGLEAAFESPAVNNNVVINRVFYQFPLGSDFTVTAGGVVRQDDMLAMWPSAYPADTVLDFFTLAGAPGTYNLNLGAGAGIWWQKDGFSISANYVSNNGNSSKPSSLGNGAVYNPDTGVRQCGPNSGGIATDCAGSTGTVQIGYAEDNWGIAAAYNYSSQNVGNLYQGVATPLAQEIGIRGNTNSVGLSAYWSPEESGWIPSISAGWGLNSTSGNDYGNINGVDRYSTFSGYKFKSGTTQSWMVGLQWSDVFLKGNSAGMAVGQQGFVTALDLGNETGTGFGSASNAEKVLVRDGQYAWEWWYMFQVTDNISVTPALFYLSRPLGAATQDNTFNQFGGLVKTTFKF